MAVPRLLQGVEGEVMGNNLNLCDMLGLPKTFECPRCHNVVESYHDDFDVDCGNPNPAPGVWSFDRWCPVCDHRWVAEYTVELKEKKA